MTVTYKYYNNTTVKPGSDTMPTKSIIKNALGYPDTPETKKGVLHDTEKVQESTNASKLLADTLNAFGSKYADITVTYNLRPGVNGVLISEGVTVKEVGPYITEGRVDFALSKALNSLDIAVKKINSEGEYGDIGIKHVDFIIGNKKNSVYAVATLHPLGKDFIYPDKIEKRASDILKSLGDVESVSYSMTSTGMKIGFEVNTTAVSLRTEPESAKRPSLGSILKDALGKE